MENRKPTVGIPEVQKRSDDDDKACISPGIFSPNYNSIRSTRSNASGNSVSTIFAYDNPALVPDTNATNGAEKRTSLYHEMDHVLERNYDPHDFGNIDKPTTFWGTVFHLIYLSAGPGMLFIPGTFVNVGSIYGSVFTFVIIYFYAYNVHLVVWSEYEICKLKRTPRLTYPEVVFHAFKMGPAGVQWLAPYMQWFMYFIFIVVWWAGCAYGNTLAAKNLQLIFNYLLHDHASIHQMLRILLVPLIGLALIRKLSYLEPLSVVGLIFNYFSLVIVVYYIVTDPAPWMMENAIQSISCIPLLMGTILISLNVTALIIPLKSEMKSPGKFNSPFGVLTISYAFISVTITFFSLVCSLKYGKNIDTIVFENLPQDQFLAQLGNLFYTLALLLIYPLLFYVSFDVIWNNILKERKIRDFIFYEYAVRAVLALLIFVFSYVVPNMTFFLSVGGTVGTSMDSLIFPTIVQILVARNVPDCRKKFGWILFKNLMIAGFGCLLMIAGLYDAVTELLG